MMNLHDWSSDGCVSVLPAGAMLIAPLLDETIMLPPTAESPHEVALPRAVTSGDVAVEVTTDVAAAQRAAADRAAAQRAAAEGAAAERAAAERSAAE